jgi:hypothetical protein
MNAIFSDNLSFENGVNIELFGGCLHHERFMSHHIKSGRITERERDTGILREIGY